MLLISWSPQYILAGVIPEEDEYHPATGRYLGTKRGVDAHFSTARVTSWALEQALENPVFHQRWHGLPDGAILAAYVSAYDTDREATEQGWTPDQKKEVERVLTSSPDFGTCYFLAEQRHPAPPYPNYVKATTVVGRRTLEHVLAKVKALVEEDGYPADQLRAYENWAQRSESEEILAALEKAEETVPQFVQA